MLENTSSHSNTEVKQDCAKSVLVGDHFGTHDAAGMDSDINAANRCEVNAPPTEYRQVVV